MKKLIHILTFLSFLIPSITIQSQNFEGKITMKMEILDVPKEMEQMKAMLESTITTYTKGKKSRVEMSNPMSGNSIIITDLTKNEVVMCMDMMGQKTAIVSTTDQYEEQNGQKEDVKVEYVSSNETKTIAGHSCKKTIAKIEHEGEKMDMEIWYAPDIANTNLQMSEVSGMPLEYTMKVEQFKMHFIATDVTEQSVSNDKFDIPAGYTLKTSEEFQKEMGGGTYGK
jgi:hypothetical protein